MNAMKKVPRGTPKKYTEPAWIVASLAKKGEVTSGGYPVATRGAKCSHTVCNNLPLAIGVVKPQLHKKKFSRPSRAAAIMNRDSVN
jgi:hypothetical protein